jgi:uncharacterized protein YndB with AHSA1/START domain
MIAFQTEVRINRPIEEVFSFVSDPLEFPRWNSAVQAVRKTTAGEHENAPTYSMERDLPTGHAVNELEVVASEWPRAFEIRTNAGPTPFCYRYRFSADGGQTIVRLDAEVDLPRSGTFLRPMARRFVKKGVDDNFAALRQILEAAGR